MRRQPQGAELKDQLYFRRKRGICKDMAATSFEIKETILSLPKKSETDVYHTELNIVSWFGKEPKLDIRGWSDDHEKMTKGISLTEDEFIKIARAGLEKLGGK